jgi:hypothetical protein
MEITKQAITGQERSSDAAAPYHALVSFYKAFNSQNLELMANNWLQTDEASMSNPLGGIKRGWHEIEAVYNKIFHGEADVYVEFYDYSIHATESMFVSVGRERGVLKVAGKEVELAIRTSRMYRLDGNQWKQIHHHGSMDNPQLLNIYQSTLLGK